MLDKYLLFLKSKSYVKCTIINPHKNVFKQQLNKQFFSTWIKDIIMNAETVLTIRV